MYSIVYSYIRIFNSYYWYITYDLWFTSWHRRLNKIRASARLACVTLALILFPRCSEISVPSRAILVARSQCDAHATL